MKYHWPGLEFVIFAFSGSVSAYITSEIERKRTVDLKNKSVILPAKIDLFRNSKALKFRTNKQTIAKPWASPAAERNIVLWRKRRKLGGIGFTV